MALETGISRVLRRVQDMYHNRFTSDDAGLALLGVQEAGVPGSGSAPARRASRGVPPVGKGPKPGPKSTCRNPARGCRNEVSPLINTRSQGPRYPLRTKTLSFPATLACPPAWQLQNRWHPLSCLRMHSIRRGPPFATTASPSANRMASPRRRTGQHEIAHILIFPVLTVIRFLLQKDDEGGTRRPTSLSTFPGFLWART